MGSDGSFQRQQSVFRSFVEDDPNAEFPAESGRYHLYVSLACPWASRVVIVRALKGLEQAIGMTVVDPVRDEKGWRFREQAPDTVNGFEYLSEAYLACDPAFSDRVTVPVLWDTRQGLIVNNESSEIMRMLELEFDRFAERPEVDLLPDAKRSQIDELNSWIYPLINNGVYAAGFAATQEAYDRAVRSLFDALDRADALLAESRFLCGPEPTEADWRLFVTLVRFDAAYVGHFKCNIRRIADYPNLSGYLRDCYQWPGIADTVDIDQIKRHYYMTHPEINPTRIVPDGPELDLTSDPGRSPAGA
ncbi:MAG: glutathione S-transferase family protein [Actinobacteria bacterium]|uniref:Unannotated protein n=1 Tax=freshwater metagenome TaxID=449393 RepID=A0A6J5ZU50_9ZZZZ|nr:glutathione S-transferase family protein [Actinomycetota bacterium]